MPQKRNPVALEHARAITSKAVGQAAGVMLAVHNTPFGDIVDTEDDLQPLVHSAFRDGTRAVRLVAAAMRGADFNCDLMEARAGANWITVTELADTLTRDHGLPFRHSHAIASKLIAARERQPEAPISRLLAGVSEAVAGAPIRYTDAQIAQLLSPLHFVRVRTAPGGPAPTETARAIGVSRATLESDTAWLESTREELAAARRDLRASVEAL
jgi:argininosuccinate lyase